MSNHTDKQDLGKKLTQVLIQGGLTHAFVVEFETAAERDYYVNLDPVHQSFKKDIEPFVEKVTVVDFTNGAF